MGSIFATKEDNFFVENLHHDCCLAYPLNVTYNRVNEGTISYSQETNRIAEIEMIGKANRKH